MASLFAIPVGGLGASLEAQALSHVDPIYPVFLAAGETPLYSATPPRASRDIPYDNEAGIFWRVHYFRQCCLPEPAPNTDMLTLHKFAIKGSMKGGRSNLAAKRKAM